MGTEESADDVSEMRKLAETRTLLEKKISEAEGDLDSLKILLGLVNKTLLASGFKRAKVPKAESAKAKDLLPTNYETVEPLKTATGGLLADLLISQDSMSVRFAEGRTFSVKTPPFQQFLVERVLNKMQEKDAEAAGKGQISPEKAFSYELILDGDILREMAIKNVTSERLRELKSSIRWTLEKMSEKSSRSV
jgi:hypothetical protein